jgi:hypothetical protein
MGVSTSSLPPTREELLATLEPADERLLLRNFQLLAAHDPALPGTFGAAEWFAFHAAMPPRLREATLAGLRGDDGSINLDTVVRAITLPTQAAADAALLWHDCLPTAALPEMLQACTEAAEWLAQLESTAHAGRAAEWARLRGAFDADQARGAAARASRPVSRAAFAESVVASAPLLAGARVIAATVQAAWLLDYRKLQPLPQLEQGGSALLRPADLRLLAEALPPQCRHRWRLLFSAARDGASFSRLCALTVGRAPVLLVVRDTGGAVFGGACTQPLQKAPRFFGQYTLLQANLTQTQVVVVLPLTLTLTLNLTLTLTLTLTRRVHLFPVHVAAAARHPPRERRELQLRLSQPG